MADKFPLTVGGWFTKGWNTYLNNPFKMIGASLLLEFFYLIEIIIGLFIPSTMMYTMYFIFFGFYALVLPLNIGWLFFSLRLVREEKVGVLNIFDGFRRFFASIFLYLLLFLTILVPVAFLYFGEYWSRTSEDIPIISTLSALVVIVGAIIIMIPSAFLFLKYNLALFAIMDKPLSFTQSLVYSRKITIGYKGELLLLYIVKILLSFLQSPFIQGLNSLYNDSGRFSLLIGIIPYLAYIIVFNPWITSSLATAYNNLVKLDNNTIECVEKRTDTSNSNEIPADTF